ncbi:universal stress protein [Pseudonocardia alni subsp. carboxydivorans]|uniref:Universal stress protein n=1 Tax=Pseudonocardia alni subsp. carboxydivorans TaxID=415010 RepID=A0ABU9APC4_PSEA5
MNDANESPEVVGVDGSESALRAVRWAARDAAAAGRPLRLVAVSTDPPPLADAGPEVWAELRAATVAAAEDHLRTAAAAVAPLLPPERVGTVVRDGRPAAVLADESRHAAVVVVGNRGRGGFRGLLLGSTGVALTASAHCPLVVVRGNEAADGPVVVGVDGSDGSEAALAYAVETAAQRRTALVAVRAWGEPAMDPAVAVLLDTVELRRAQAEELEQAVAALREKYPDVPVTTHVTHGSAAAALKGASAEAGMVVVGARGRGGLAGLVLGSVAQSLVHHAACPVAVVRPEVSRRVAG